MYYWTTEETFFETFDATDAQAAHKQLVKFYEDEYGEYAYDFYGGLPTENYFDPFTPVPRTAETYSFASEEAAIEFAEAQNYGEMWGIKAIDCGSIEGGLHTFAFFGKVLEEHARCC